MGVKIFLPLLKKGREWGQRPTYTLWVATPNLRPITGKVYLQENKDVQKTFHNYPFKIQNKVSLKRANDKKTLLPFKF